MSACSPGDQPIPGPTIPFEGDVGALGVFLRATATHGEQRPFGYYRITRLADGRAIGGLGFKSQPDGGCVEIGYGLAPSARGHGYAAEAVIALLTVAADHGCTRRARKRRRESHMADVVAIAGWSLAFADDATPQGAGDVRRAASAEVAGMVI